MRTKPTSPPRRRRALTPSHEPATDSDGPGRSLKRSGDWRSVPFETVVGLIEGRVGDVAAARAIAALFEQYGRRASESPAFASLRAELLRFVNATWPERAMYAPSDEAPADVREVGVRDELPRHLDDADALLWTLEKARGGAWPVFLDVIARPNDGPLHVGLVLRTERALGYSAARGSGITDESMLLVLAVALLRTVGTRSDSEAVAEFVEISEMLGHPRRVVGHARSQLARAKRMILSVLADELARARGSGADPWDRWSRGVRRAYDARAAELPVGTKVALPPKRRAKAAGGGAVGR